MKKLLIIAAILLLSGCVYSSNPDKAYHILEYNKYTEIKMTGYSMFTCEEKFIYGDKFEAKSSSGKKVTGVVCSGGLIKSRIVLYHN